MMSQLFAKTQKHIIYQVFFTSFGKFSTKKYKDNFTGNEEFIQSETAAVTSD